MKDSRALTVVFAFGLKHIKKSIPGQNCVMAAASKPSAKGLKIKLRLAILSF